mmetsp:Transcript_99868/g.286938  ORF Transcript_99868/g.286938 Transcript_99868/m.286938 type:complete len:216 (+) Transcript_99868:1144-1791(+)
MFALVNSGLYRSGRDIAGSLARTSVARPWANCNFLGRRHCSCSTWHRTLSQWTAIPRRRRSGGRRRLQRPPLPPVAPSNQFVLASGRMPSFALMKLSMPGWQGQSQTHRHLLCESRSCGRFAAPSWWAFSRGWWPSGCRQSKLPQHPKSMRRSCRNLATWGLKIGWRLRGCSINTMGGYSVSRTSCRRAPLPTPELRVGHSPVFRPQLQLSRRRR